MWENRTDLAIEEKEQFPGDGGEISGVELEETVISGWKRTKVVIRTRQGEQSMKKPRGCYLTLEYQQEGDFEIKTSAELVETVIRELLPEKTARLLVVGLGNASMTVDSLGPAVLKRIRANRHLREDQNGISAVVPGVMAQTGMESAEMIKGIAKETRPEAILVLDALAARSARRLGRTIQLTDTGIIPGGGVGNHRMEITQASMGVPVIAVGVPTVISASSLIYDTICAMRSMLGEEELDVLGMFRDITEQETHRLADAALSPLLERMTLAPRNVDEMIQRMAILLAEGINKGWSLE